MPDYVAQRRIMVGDVAYEQGDTVTVDASVGDQLVASGYVTSVDQAAEKPARSRGKSAGSGETSAG